MTSTTRKPMPPSSSGSRMPKKSVGEDHPDARAGQRSACAVQAVAAEREGAVAGVERRQPVPVAERGLAARAPELHRAHRSRRPPCTGTRPGRTRRARTCAGDRDRGGRPGPENSASTWPRVCTSLPTETPKKMVATSRSAPPTANQAALGRGLAPRGGRDGGPGIGRVGLVRHAHEGAGCPISADPAGSGRMTR